MTIDTGFKCGQWYSVPTALRAIVPLCVVPDAVFAKIVCQYISIRHPRLSPADVAAASTDYTLTPGSQRSPSDVAAALRNSGCENLRCHLTAEFAPRLTAIAETGMQLRQLVLIPVSSGDEVSEDNEGIIAAVRAVIDACCVVELWLTLPSAPPLSRALSAGRFTVRSVTTALPPGMTVSEAQDIAASSPHLVFLTLFQHGARTAPPQAIGALVAGLRSLQSLTFQDVEFSDAVADALTGARSGIVSLSCTMTCSSTAAVSFFESCPALRELRVRDLCLDACEALGRSAALETLYVDAAIDDAHLVAVLTPRMVSRLRFLSFGAGAITESGLALVARCSDLRDLFISARNSTSGSPTEGTAAAAQAILAGCPRLRHLALWSPTMGEAVVRELYSARGDGTEWRGPGRTAVCLERLEFCTGPRQGVRLGEPGSLRTLAVDCAKHIAALE